MDDFDDDDLDSLNPLALQQLEENAIQFTQAAQARPLNTQRSLAYDDFEYDDLDDAVVQDDLRGTSAISPQRVPQPYAQHAPVTTPSQHAAWGQPPAPPQASIASRPLHRAVHAPAYGSSRPQPPPPAPRPAPSIPARYQATQAPVRQAASAAHELATLQAQIRDLQSRLTTKDGEIQIVRSRLEKSQQDHEREMQNMKKQSAEQLAKLQRAAEVATIAQQTAATELQFTRRDLRDELERAKTRTANGPTTPKKNAAAKSWGVSDGFEDVEMANSPTRGRAKHAGPVATMVAEPKGLRTPTKNKRKRPAFDSPVMELEIQSDDVGAHAGNLGSGSLGDPATTAREAEPIANYLQIILNHRSSRDRPMTFDYLSGFSLPSKPSQSIASRLLECLALVGTSDEPLHLPVQFCKEVVQVWDECFKESCLAPISELVALILFTVQLNTTVIAPRIASRLLPVALNSCYEVAIPRFNHSGPGDPTDASWKNFNAHIPCTQIMSLLYLVALGCASTDQTKEGAAEPIVEFWTELQMQFMLMWLSQKHPVQDFCIGLRILCTSVFPTSIGPRSPHNSPEEVAQIVIERVSVPLIEGTRWGIEREELHEVRVLILRTLATFATTAFGYRQLVGSDWVVPRLVALLASSIDELYEGNMQYISATSEEAGPGSALQVLVNHTIFLLHAIVMNPLSQPGRPVDTDEKLRGLSGPLAGAPHKYVLSLARLNYSESLVSEETAELAHELLDLAVTPEQAAELSSFFDG
ncbi:uncharacterized protein B0I36DRAFT_239215 [Microdochium trichocladiopsis]|uniref:DNA repair protein Rad26 n=1 Tax=Microdochium trichocladiopsis TaxID=1682393 RepID=A0A9P8YDG0_9PEZI|nr:uncharacterized protein B0I36DRAFT_239215 [Microdochium trichocladiopsis]KAH7035885.1 hypothetical protein B0I36DRAFT_239215 [Microdochium trichocladiopsis]